MTDQEKSFAIILSIAIAVLLVFIATGLIEISDAKDRCIGTPATPTLVQ